MESLAQRFQLSSDDRGQLLQNGQPRFNNRVGWATTYLKKAGLLQAVGRGRFELTDRGRDLLATNPDAINIAFLEGRFPEVVEFRKARPKTDGENAPAGQGDPAKALEMTQAAAPYELAVPGTAYFTGAAFFGALYPVYVRGLAYSQLGRPSEAAAEFQTILDHPGLVLNDPIGSMARLQLARALSASGDRAKSAAVYADLLTLWKDADPDTPVLRQAKAECAGLQ